MAKITNFEITPCADYTGNECTVPEGKVSNLTINFTPTEDIKALTTTIHAKIGIWVPYPLGPLADACASGEVKCPIKAGVATEYNFSFNPSTSYPKVSKNTTFSTLKLSSHANQGKFYKKNTL